MKKIKEMLRNKYPNVEKYDNDLFEDYLLQRSIMEEISNNLDVPLDELMLFFYKGYIKKDLIERKELEYGR